MVRTNRTLLTPEQIAELREKYKQPGVVLDQLAQEYGVSRGTVHNYIKGVFIGGEHPRTRVSLSHYTPVDDELDSSKVQVLAIYKDGKSMGVWYGSLPELLLLVKHTGWEVAE